jgi:hypothetical protein
MTSTTSSFTESSNRKCAIRAGLWYATSNSVVMRETPQEFRGNKIEVGASEL